MYQRGLKTSKPQTLLLLAMADLFVVNNAEA